MEVARDGAANKILTFVFLHRSPFRVRCLHVNAPLLEHHASLFQQSKGSFFRCVVDESPRAITIHERDEAPLREEVAHLVFVVFVGHSTDKHLARIHLAQQARSALGVLATWRRESHDQRSGCARKVLRVDNRGIRISGELEGDEGVGSALRIVILRRGDAHIDDLPILRELRPDLRLADARWQAPAEHLQMFPHGVVLVYSWDHTVHPNPRLARRDGLGPES